MQAISKYQIFIIMLSLFIFPPHTYAHRMILPEADYNEELPEKPDVTEPAINPNKLSEEKNDSDDVFYTMQEDIVSDEIDDQLTDQIDEKNSDAFILKEFTITGERPLSAASDMSIRNKDFMNFPLNSASDLLRLVPGLHITQHTGGAKAHQIFLRGYDAEHGMDIAAFFDGIPLNESSHVHGQGYLDLHFLIPESIKKVWLTNGTYDPRFGNFASAGVINFIPYETKRHNYSASLSGGSNYFAEAIAELYQNWYQMDTYMVAQFDYTKGYTSPGRAGRGRAFLSHTFLLGQNLRLKLLYSFYMARSLAADILPKEWIDSGKISRFSAIDDSNMVDVDRHLAALTLDLKSSKIALRVQAYYNYKRTLIFSNYTFFMFNEQQGDQLKQYDKRHWAGINSYLKHKKKSGEMLFKTEGGLTIRSDWVNQSQANTTKREQFNLINKYKFNETALGAYLSERMTLASFVRIILGMRFDMLFYNVDGTQDKYGEFDVFTNQTPFLQDQPISATTSAYALSPKASVIFTPLKDWDIFLNFGRGFISQHARQITAKPDSTCPSVIAAELSSRVKLFKGVLSFALTGWYSQKETEVVFDSESGLSIEKGESRRIGGDFELRISPLPWLYIANDLYYVKANFVDGNLRVPNMATWMMTNIISINHSSGFKTNIRGRFVGERYHDLGYTSSAYYLVDLQVGYKFDNFTISLNVENLFNTTWYDSVYAYAARPETNGKILEGLYITPGTPTSAKLKIEANF